MSKYFGSKKDKDTKGIEGSSDNFTDRYDRGYSRHTQWWEEDDYYSDKLDRDAKDLTTHKPYTPSSYTDWTWKGYGGYGYGGGYTSWSYKSYTSTKLTEAMKEEAARAIARVRVFEQGDLPKDVDQEFIDSVKETECATYTGYQKFAYIADVNGAFLRDPTAVIANTPEDAQELGKCSSVKRDLHEIAEKGFTRNTMYGFDVHADDSKLPSDAKAAAVSYYKFFSRFKHSPIRQMILEVANWDADTATKLFFENCGGDSAGIEDLNELVQKDKKELESLGMKAGKGPGNLTQINRYLTLKKLVKIIRKSWEFAGERTIQIRKVPYPAEEVDYRTNHSYQEVIKTTMENFANPALMVLKMIQGGLTVRQFEEHIPGPPKQFGVYIDSSGSMHSPMNVPYIDEKGKKAELTCTRTDWSVAVAICIVQAAHKSSNKVSIYGWDSRICTKLEDATPDKAEEYLWRFPHSGGGTQLDCVIESVNGRKGELEAAIVITDGDVDLSLKWPEHTPLFTVYAFGKDENHPNPRMNEWSVKWMMVDSVMDKSAKDGWHKGGKAAKVEGENK